MIRGDSSDLTILLKELTEFKAWLASLDKEIPDSTTDYQKEMFKTHKYIRVTRESYHKGNGWVEDKVKEEFERDFRSSFFKEFNKIITTSTSYTKDQYNVLKLRNPHTELLSTKYEYKPHEDKWYGEVRLSSAYQKSLRTQRFVVTNNVKLLIEKTLQGCNASVHIH